MSEQEIRVPDLGGADEVEVIEIRVDVGDSVAEEDAILEVETDKASVELPAPASGTIKSITVKVGDTIREGDVVGTLDAAGAQDSDGGDDKQSDAQGEQQDQPETPEEDESDQGDAESGASESRLETVHVPDLGGSENVPVVEIHVRPGDQVAEEDPLVTVESDKAAMEIPSPYAGTIESLSVKDGDTVSEGDPLVQMTVEGASSTASESSQPSKPERSEGQASSAPKKEPSKEKAESTPAQAEEPVRPSGRVHAGPAVRKLAREFGVDLAQVRGSGPKRRILKDDVQEYVKGQLQGGGAAAPAGGGGIPGVKLPDFSQYGEVEREGMNGIAKATADAMQRSWLNVPHVTQFDECDITDMDAFRKSLKAEGEQRGVKMTPMAFLLKAAAHVLQLYPQFNVSLDMAKKEKIVKHYIHIGIAVDTPEGLVVPVIRDVDQKGLWQLAEEAQQLAKKARDKKLTREDMSGACFTITSLGGIGGTAFTPIVNTPEVAILGVSKAAMKPVWDGEQFEPRLMLPLSLSYDHRAINGADAARFTNALGQVLSDTRRLLL